jgi:hypothetical protein
MTATEFFSQLILDLALPGGIPSNGARPTPSLTTTAATIDSAAVVANYKLLAQNLIFAQQRLANIEGVLAQITVSNVINEIAFRVASPSAKPADIFGFVPFIAMASGVAANLAALETALTAQIVTPAQTELNNFVTLYQSTLTAAGIST